MKLTAQALSIVLMALFLQACQLGEDDEDDGTVETIIYSTDEGTPTITSNDLYELILKADDTISTLEDDIFEITVQGDENYVIIDSDTSIDSISITGNNNIFVVEDGVELTVTDLSIVGNGNSVTVFSVTNTPVISSDQEGTANLVCQNSVCT